MTTQYKGLVAVLSVLLAVGIAESVIVNTQYGPVQGQTLTLNDGQAVNSYLGIPFAKAPTGSRRWKAPEDPEPWKEPFIANEIRSACVQDVGVILLTHLFWDDYSEDCLHLNIYTPKDMSKGPYPVLFWIFGGGFGSGANFQYPGHFLASRDVVVVAPNYRLGALGFVSTGDSASPGNYGLLDQHKALAFVRDNIKNFGGDPNKVTIAGESAGAASVGFHVISPMSKGLFHQAIYQSGSDLAPWAFEGKEQKPESYTRQLAEKVSCPTQDNEKMMECLRTKPADTLMEVSIECNPGFICLGFAPVADGSFIPENPYAMREKGSFNKVPTMIGHNSDEGSIYTALALIDQADDGFTKEQYREVLMTVSELVTKSDPTRKNDAFEALRFYYSPWGQLENKTLNRAMLNDLVTDAAFGFTGDLTIRSAAKYSPTYSYLMRYRSSNATEFFPKWMGVFHALELPYTWGFNYVRKTPAVDWEAQFTHDIIDWNEEDDKMADYIMDMWTDFVKTGNPTPTPSSPIGKEPVSWRQYAEDTQQKFVIDRTATHVTRYRQRNYAFFREYAPFVLGNRI